MSRQLIIALVSMVVSMASNLLAAEEASGKASGAQEAGLVVRALRIEVLEVEHGDLFQDFGIDRLGFLRQQATLLRRKRNRLSDVEFHHLFFQTATFLLC